jgi:predicted MFS family arabinose efflux permease
LVAGTVLIALGMMMTSLCTQYWHVMLAQGIWVGLGTGCLYIPSIALVPQYFTHNRALAVGVVVTGSSFGGVIYPIAFQGLQPKIGFGWTMRVLGFVSLLTLVFPLVVLRRRDKPAQIRSLLELEAFREPPYALYCAALFLSNWAFFTPVFYLQPYALQHGLSGQTIALYLVAILNAVSVLGRLAPSLIANRIGPVHTLLICILGTGITTFAWIGTNTGWGNILFAVAFGFFSGGIVASPVVVLTSFTTDLSRLGTRLGMSSVLNAIGALIGAPIGGAILNSTGSYTAIQIYAGTIVFSTGLCLVALRFALTGRKLIAIA